MPLEVRLRSRRGSAPRLVAYSLVLLSIFSPVTLQAQSADSTDHVAAENPDHDRYIQPSERIQEILTTDVNYAELSYPSPDGEYFLIPHKTELSTLELMSRETYRLAGLELRPQTDRLWHLDTWGIDGFRFYSLEYDEFVEPRLPDDSFFSDFTWSPDGSKIAFLAHLPGGTEVWTGDPASGRAERLSDARVLATLGTSSQGQGTRPSRMLQWTPEGTIITLLVPLDRPAEPERDRVPVSPVVRRTRDEATPSRTYPLLLDDEHDELLFEHYTRSQIAELAEGRAPRFIGEPGMYRSISVSPDGAHILATRTERPFSFRVYHSRFPQKTLILDRDGDEVVVLDEQPLRETGGLSGGRARARSFSWRPDGAGLSFLKRPARDEEGEDLPTDRVHLLTEPWDVDEAPVVVESEVAIRSVVYSLDGEDLFANVSKSGRRGVMHYDLGETEPVARTVVDFHSTTDPLELPGELMTRQTGNGLEYAVVSSDRRSAYLAGEGYRVDFRPQPFVDRVTLGEGGKAGETERLFEGSRDYFERPLVVLDEDLDRMIVSREGVREFPDSYLWERSGSMTNLTQNRDPFPEITAVERIDFSFTLHDSVEVQGRVSMPVGWEPGDDPVPALFWTYPREYVEAERYTHAAIRARNHNAFTHMTWLRWSDIWLAAGYALVYPDIPIIGENYNDTYISSLSDAMYGAIRAVDSLGVVDIDRIAHGGHSYGGFATANILANAPYFKAGIAGSGAYNRSLTPMGFQAERRILWEAPHTYIEMSPFFRAHQIDAPVLIYHGGDDNNSGTYPVQSRRLIHALTSLGKTAVLYEYPYESHTLRAIETKMDMWARFTEWLDRYLQPADAVEYAPDHVSVSRTRPSSHAAGPSDHVRGSSGPGVADRVPMSSVAPNGYRSVSTDYESTVSPLEPSDWREP